MAPSRIESQLIPSESGESGCFGGLRGLFGTRINTESPISNRRFRIENRKIDAYSAASAKADFGFADDMMKSEMRGTISDLKREPLNTP
jgi:hypothetical protein